MQLIDQLHNKIGPGAAMLSANPDGIKTVRGIEPDFGRTTPKMLCDAFLHLKIEDASVLCRKFASWAPATQHSTAPAVRSIRPACRGIGGRFMYLMYVDESGDTGLVSSPTRYFALSGIVVHETRWRDFLTALVDFRKILKAAYGLPIRAEIHSMPFISRRPVPLERYVRLAILRNVLDELAKMDFISITNVIVDKAGKGQDFDVFHCAWGTLFQRFENTLAAGNFPGGHRTDSGIVITDAIAGRRLLRLVRKMAVHNYIPHDQSYGGGARNVPIKRVIEDPHGKDSAETLPVQMADVVAYFLTQRYAPNAYIRKKRAQRYFDRLESVLNKSATRFNQLGIVTR